MSGISLMISDGFVILPIEQTMVWSLFYATLFWLPVRGVAAVFDRGSDEEDEYAHELEHDPQMVRSRRVYHVGMRVLPPF